MMGISALLDFFEEPPEAGIVSDSFAAMGVFFRVEGKRAPTRPIQLALEVDYFFHHGIRHSDNPRIRLECTLSHN